jgi:DNA polymerase-3 subunit delta
MPGVAPNIYLLHGEDEFSIAQFLADQAIALGGASMQDLNVSRLDGRSLTLDGLRRAVGALPMFSARKIVVVEHVGKMASSPASIEALLALLDRVPGTTQLMLVEYHPLKPGHWLVGWANKVMDRVVARPFPKKNMDMMVRWIEEQVKKGGGKFAPGSAEALFSLVGSDTRLAYQEIQKLITYAGLDRAVMPDDVLNLCGYLGQANIFALVDALGAQDGKRAQYQLHKLLKEDDPRRIFGMIVRQFRLLLLAREILDTGGRLEEVLKELSLVRFVGEKIVTQARRYSLSQLEIVYHRLLEWDEAIKSGLYEDEIMLESITVEFTSRQA